MAWSWEVSTDIEEVHSLLCACDAYQSNRELPAPVRSIETTRRRVRAGSVHLLRFGTEPVAMFTLTLDPPFSDDRATFPSALKPTYLSRLAVRPDWLARGSIVGARCIRKAIEVAASLGADAVRSEANPDLKGVTTVLRLFGFQEYGRTQAEDGRRRVYLQKTLDTRER